MEFPMTRQRMGEIAIRRDQLHLEHSNLNFLPDSQVVQLIGIGLTETEYAMYRAQLIELITQMRPS